MASVKARLVSTHSLVVRCLITCILHISHGTCISSVCYAQSISKTPPVLHPKSQLHYRVRICLDTTWLCMMFLEQPLIVPVIYRIKYLITSHVFDPRPSRAVRPSADNPFSRSDLADISSIERLLVQDCPISQNIPCSYHNHAYYFTCQVVQLHRYKIPCRMAWPPPHPAMSTRDEELRDIQQKRRLQLYHSDFQYN